MSLNAFVLFTLGVLAELVFLLEKASPALLDVRERPPLAEDASAAAALWWRIFTPARELVSYLAIAAAVLIGLFALTGIGGLQVYIDTPVVNIVMIALALLVLSAGVAAGLFLPPVTEQTILLVQGLVLASALLEGRPVDWLPAWAMTALPLLVGVLLLAWPRAFPVPVKAVIYLWYLLCLMAIPFQSGQISLINQPNLNWPEACASGMLLAFLVLHGLFTARFLILTLSMLRRRNRAMLALAMQPLFLDQQTPLLRSLLIALLLGGLLWANHLTRLLNTSIALSLCSLLAVQLLNARQAHETQADPAGANQPMTQT